jgi:hypothetical protein
LSQGLSRIRLSFACSISHVRKHPASASSDKLSSDNESSVSLRQPRIDEREFIDRIRQIGLPNPHLSFTALPLIYCHNNKRGKRIQGLIFIIHIDWGSWLTMYGYQPKCDRTFLGTERITEEQLNRAK